MSNNSNMKRGNNMKNEINYVITDRIATLSVAPSGWATELNLISWNGNEPKYDIRDWSPDHKKMGKGIVLSEDEFMMLVDVGYIYINGEPEPMNDPDPEEEEELEPEEEDEPEEPEEEEPEEEEPEEEEPEEEEPVTEPGQGFKNGKKPESLSAAMAALFK